jgi:glycerol uptake facilitator protein
MTQAKPTLAAELLAEFLGTLVLIVLGDGVVAMVVLFDPNVPGAFAKGGYTNITLGWGLAVTMGVFVAGRVSGAHLNPAVTLTLALRRDFPWGRVLPYSLAQTAGAFVAAFLVFVNFLPQIRRVDPETVHLAGIFATFPAVPDAFWGFALFDQIVGTALLVGLIFAITDPRNQPVAPGLTPILIGLVVVAIGVSWGGMHGYAINPARDLGPRLFTVAAGLRDTGFATNAWWVPVVGPLIGGPLGGLFYDEFIRRHLPSSDV